MSSRTAFLKGDGVIKIDQDWNFAPAVLTVVHFDQHKTWKASCHGFSGSERTSTKEFCLQRSCVSCGSSRTQQNTPAPCASNSAHVLQNWLETESVIRCFGAEGEQIKQRIKMNLCVISCPIFVYLSSDTQKQCTVPSSWVPHWSPEGVFDSQKGAARMLFCLSAWKKLESVRSQRESKARKGCWLFFTFFTFLWKYSSSSSSSTWTWTQAQHPYLPCVVLFSAVLAHTGWPQQKGLLTHNTCSHDIDIFCFSNRSTKQILLRYLHNVFGSGSHPVGHVHLPKICPHTDSPRFAVLHQSACLTLTSCKRALLAKR